MDPIKIWKDSFRVNETTAGWQNQAETTTLSNGRILVVWRDDNDSVADGNGADIVGQIFDPLGRPIGETLFLNDGYGANRSEYLPDVAATEDGGFVLTYGYYGSGGEYDFLTRRFDAEGEPMPGHSSYVINDGTGAPYYSDVEIVHRPDGTSVVTYRKDAGSDEDLKFKVIAANGAVGSEQELRYDQDPTGSVQGDPDNPTSAVLKDGRVITAFLEEDNNLYGPEFSIINTNNTVSMRGNVVIAAGQRDIDVAALENGGFVISWRMGEALQVQIYNDAVIPAKVGPMLTLNDQAGAKRNPQVTELNDGGFALAWVDLASNEIKVQTFDETGGATSAVTTLAGVQNNPTNLDLETHDDGRLLVTWEESDTGTSGTDLFSAILDPRPETLIVDDGAVTVASHEGSVIRGAAYDDVFFGQKGVDYIYGRGGDDRITGGKNDDRLWGGNDDDRLEGQRGADQLKGDDGEDRLYGGSGNDRAWGGDDADYIRGGTGSDKLSGDRGDDALMGDKGNDQIWGGKGRDALWGGKGNDMLNGSGGQDKMTGGYGADSFVFTSASHSKAGSAYRDTITDFQRGLDVIDLSRIDADTTTRGNQAFDFEGRSGFDEAGDLRYRKAGDDLIVQADRNGDGRADFEIRLEDMGYLSADDFIL